MGNLIDMWAMSRGFLLAVMILGFSIFSGPILFPQNHLSPPAAELSTQLNENIPLLFYTKVTVGIITSVSSNDFSFTNDYHLKFGITQFVFTKNINGTQGETIYPSDSRFNTTEWRLNPTPCCLAPLNNTIVRGSDTLISNLFTSLRKDVNSLTNYVNVTGSEKQIRATLTNTTGQVYWQIFQYFTNNLTLIMEALGPYVFVTIQKLDSLIVKNSDYIFKMVSGSYQTALGKFNEKAFSNFETEVNAMLNAIYGRK